jgi:hypothetical protein
MADISTSPIGIYCECMEEIKTRSGVIASVLTRDLSIGRDDFDYELVALQLRKILELMAFSSIASNLEQYEATYENAHRHWHAERILKDVERINPHFFPVPARVGAPNADGVRSVEVRTDDSLTRSEFETLYALCGTVLHIGNALKGKKSVNFVHHPGIWLMKINNLLSTHYVRLIDDGHVWVVTMEHPENGHVHAVQGEPYRPEA